MSDLATYHASTRILRTPTIFRHHITIVNLYDALSLQGSALTHLSAMGKTIVKR